MQVRPIYRSLRKDAELIDGRVGETFSGIRVVRAFGRECASCRLHARAPHDSAQGAVRAAPRDGALDVVGTAARRRQRRDRVVRRLPERAGRASIGDIMAFQWYTFLLLNPVWNIVNSFSELQRSLAAMERVFEMLGDGGGQARPSGRARRAARRARDPVRARRVRVSRGHAGGARIQCRRCRADRSSRSSAAAARGRRR